MKKEFEYIAKKLDFPLMNLLRFLKVKKSFRDYKNNYFYNIRCRISNLLGLDNRKFR